MLSRRLLVPLVAVPLACGTVLAGSASAAPAPVQAYSSVSLGSAPDVVSAKPSVSIVKSGWSKASLTARRTPSSATRCTAANAGFLITNNTGVKQTVKVGTTVVATIPAHAKDGICAKASKPVTATFKLVRSGDTLKVTFR